MSLLKSKRRRQAERAVTRALTLRDEAAETFDHGHRVARVRAKSSVKAIRAESRELKRAAERQARAARKTTVRTGGHIAEMVQRNPAATVGGALALAVAVGAGVTYWTRR